MLILTILSIPMSSSVLRYDTVPIVEILDIDPGKKSPRDGFLGMTRRAVPEPGRRDGSWNILTHVGIALHRYLSYCLRVPDWPGTRSMPGQIRIVDLS